MATSKKSIRYMGFDGLLNASTSDFLMKDDEVFAIKNVYTGDLGVLEKVPGYTKIDSSQIVSGETPSFLHWYYDVANTHDLLLAVSDSSSNLTLEYIGPDMGVTSWTTISGISTTWDGYATSQVDMESFLGKTFIVGWKTGTTFVPNAVVNGVGFNTTDASLSGMPQGKYITRYRDLLYVGNVYEDSTQYPSRAYYSDDPVDGDISWTNKSTKFISVGYDNSDVITGMAEALDRLIIFKERSVWKYDESSLSKIADVGCDSYRSILKVGNVLYWFNRNGFWRWRGAEPELISAKAQPFIDAIDQTKLSNVVATEYKGFEYRAFIGDVEVEDYTYNNAWFCWDTRKETIYIRCTKDEVGAACSFREGSKVRAYFSNDDGYVMKFANKIDKVYSDDGEEIDSFFITKAYDYGVPEDVKYTTQLTTFTKYGESLKCAIDINKNNSFDATHVAQADKNIGHADIIASGNRYKYKFYEKSSNKSFQFEGFVVSTEIKEQEF